MSDRPDRVRGPTFLTRETTFLLILRNSYNWTRMVTADLTLVAPSSGSIKFALFMQRIMDQVMRVPV